MSSGKGIRCRVRKERRGGTQRETGREAQREGLQAETHAGREGVQRRLCQQGRQKWTDTDVQRGRGTEGGGHEAVASVGSGFLAVGA